MHVYLILYLWHAAGIGNGGAGGFALTIMPMPSIAACEKVGSAAKLMADDELRGGWGGQPSRSRPTAYRCIAVSPDSGPEGQAAK
jgi:hypothetical protein